MSWRGLGLSEDTRVRGNAVTSAHLIVVLFKVLGLDQYHLQLVFVMLLVNVTTHSIWLIAMVTVGMVMK